MIVDPEIIEWLKGSALYATDENVGALGESLSAETEIISCLALESDALVEAARQQDFLAGPLAIETHLVNAASAALIGQPVTLSVDKLGYEAGLTVFVIGVDEQAKTLTVLRRLT